MTSSLEYHGLPASFTFVFLVYSTSSLLAVLSHKAPSFCDKQDGEPLSFLWMVKKDPPSYLFGTIHVPYTRVWDYIPENAKQAFETCSNVFFELDLMDPYTVSALASCQMLPQGENLADVLPSDLYRRLKRHLDYVKGVMPTWMTADQRGRGMYADYLFNAITGNWERKRPVWVMLMVNSLTESDVRSRGVPVLDLYLAQEAERMNKRTGAVEKVEEQCLPLNGLNLSQVLFALNHTLHQHEELREGEVQHTTYTTDDLIRHYNCGDLNAAIFSQDTTQVPTLSNSSLAAEDALIARNIDHYFRQELIYNRNMRMGNRVVQLMNTYPDESLFFAFGAGHFLGNNTVLDFVQARGFQVQHLSVNTKIRGKVKKSRDQASKSGMWAAGVLTQDDAYYDDSDGVMSFRRTGQRPNRRRPAGLHRSMQHPYDTTPTPTTPRPRRFNDLWVRLDSYGMRNSHMPQDSPDEDSRVIKNALHTWFGSHSSRGCGSFADAMSIGTTIIFHIVLLQFQLCGEDLTGIT